MFRLHFLQLFIAHFARFPKLIHFSLQAIILNFTNCFAIIVIFRIMFLP